VVKTTIFISKLEIDKDHTINLNRNKSNYISNVLRLKTGDSIHVIDGQGSRYEALILGINHNIVTISIVRKINYEKVFYKTVLFQSILKGSSMDKVIREVAECGIKEIYPLITERTIIKKTNKITRWINIVEEASEQAGRNHIPVIHNPICIKDISFICQNNRDSIKLVFNREGLFLQDYLFDNYLESSILFVIGPEGGLLQKEIDILEKTGFIKVNLGRYTLKAETAGPLATTLIHYFIDKKISTL